MNFLVDIGTWASGRTIEIKCGTAKEALTKAKEQLVGSEEVVQIKDESFKTYFDFLNGFYY